MLYEDEYESPIWLRFKKVWKGIGKKGLYQIRKGLKDFMVPRPQLKLIMLEYYQNDINIKGDKILFSDGNTHYYEKLYSIKEHVLICYFEPDKELLEFLEIIEKSHYFLQN
jgi:hypothetical protein